MRRRALALFLLLAAAAVLAWRAPQLREAYTLWRRQAHPSAPTVILVVLDTVRADHLSACGYPRPTSPALAELARTATFTCDAYSPASWTLPAHASLFTGLGVPEHGTENAVGEGTVAHFASNRVRPLAESFETVAETLHARGYQTVSLSENPVLAEWSGLMQGFDVVQHPRDFAPENTGVLLRLLDTALGSELDPSRPLFLLVNLSGAHDPLPAIPAGVGWLPPRPELRCFGKKDADCWAFGRGELAEDTARAYLEAQRDSYDWGVAQADAALAHVLTALDRYGWRSGPHRLIVVSDHGELLGEHGIIGHGEYVWEPITRVPLLVEGVDGLVLPAPVSTRVVHELLINGALPSPMLPVDAVGNPGGYRAAQTGGRVPSVHTAARWDGHDKQLWTDGVVRRYDLAADPTEEHPLPAVDDPALLDLAAANLARFSTTDGTSAETTDQLRSLGYVK